MHQSIKANSIQTQSYVNQSNTNININSNVNQSIHISHQSNTNSTSACVCVQGRMFYFSFVEQKGVFAVETVGVQAHLVRVAVGRDAIQTRRTKVLVHLVELALRAALHKQRNKHTSTTTNKHNKQKDNTTFSTWNPPNSVSLGSNSARNSSGSSPSSHRSCEN
jgi:hypothetical protein